MAQIALNFDEVDRKLRQITEGLEETFTKRVRVNVARAGVQAMRRAVRPSIPVGPTGNLRRGLATRVVTRTRYPYGLIGFRYSRQGGVRGSAPHAHLLESGTKLRTTRTGASRGRMRATRFFERAVQLNSQRAIQSMITAIDTATTRQYEKIRRLVGG